MTGASWLRRRRCRRAEARHVAVEQQHRAGDERDHAADAEHAEGTEVDLGNQQRDAEDDQRQPGIVDRQPLQREQPEQQANRAGDARDAGARRAEFEHQAVDADHHQDQRDARVRDHRQQPVAPVGGHALGDGAAGVQRDLARRGAQPARKPFDRLRVNG